MTDTTRFPHWHSYSRGHVDDVDTWHDYPIVGITEVPLALTSLVNILNPEGEKENVNLKALVTATSVELIHRLVGESNPVERNAEVRDATNSLMQMVEMLVNFFSVRRENIKGDGIPTLALASPEDLVVVFLCTRTCEGAWADEILQDSFDNAKESIDREMRRQRAQTN